MRNEVAPGYRLKGKLPIDIWERIELRYKMSEFLPPDFDMSKLVTVTTDAFPGCGRELPAAFQHPEVRNGSANLRMSKCCVCPMDICNFEYQCHCVIAGLPARILTGS